MAVAEALCEALETKQLNKSELAIALGKSKGFVSQLLSGGRNLTLRTVANVVDALGYRPHFSMEPEPQQHWAYVGKAAVTMHEVVKVAAFSAVSHWSVVGIAAPPASSSAAPPHKENEKELAA